MTAVLWRPRCTGFFDTCACCFRSPFWVCNVIAVQVLHIKSRPDEGIQTVYGVATMIGLFMFVIGTIIVAILSVRHPGR